MNRRDFFSLGVAGAGSAFLVSQSHALEYYPVPSDLKCAILYGTWCGSTRDAALWINEGMGGIAGVFDVRENPDPGQFDHLVIGGAIRMNVTPQELQDYISLNRERIADKVRGLFAVCGNMGNPVGPEQTALFIDNHLAQLCGVTDVIKTTFNGRVTKSLMDSQTAAMMAQMEDYDKLDRSKCMELGKTILDSL